MKIPTYSVSEFAPVTRVGGYLPIEDFGLIGDGSTAALVGRDNTVAWLCLPRFDDDPCSARSLMPGTAAGSAWRRRTRSRPGNATSRTAAC